MTANMSTSEKIDANPQHQIEEKISQETVLMF